MTNLFMLCTLLAIPFAVIVFMAIILIGDWLVERYLTRENRRLFKGMK